MASKRKLSPEDEDVDPADELEFFGLGGCNEVGRSCHIIRYKGKTVMLDAGTSPAYEGISSLPFYDEYDLSTVDVLLISHFHIDHAASLPYVLAKTNFKGRVFMTHPTKAIYKWLIQDSVRVGSVTSSAEQKMQLYTEADHLSTFPQIEAIDYYTTHTISSIRITPYPAGHVLGAAMFLIEIAGLKILFTGDYSREEDRHLISARAPENVKIDVLITESTYGVATHVPRVERENMLMKTITGILNRGGRALLPVFALGRAQELLLILDEYWGKHPEYQKIPIYYASNLARKCMVVYQTYISAMNDNIKRLFRERMQEAEATGEVTKAGPWDFRYIRSLKSLDRFDDIGSCVMLASPGMMQSGVSRELLERWAPDQRNGVVITGYSVEGTMAKIIMTEPEFIPAIMTRGAATATRGKMPGQNDQVQIPRRCSVNEYAFAAHVDGAENREFVEEVNPSVVILVHGEKSQMTRFKSKLLGLNSKRKNPIKVFSPANCESLRIPFKTEKIAKVVGKLAQITAPQPPRARAADADGDEVMNDHAPEEQTEPQLITGVLVQNDFKMSLMAPEDLREYAGLTTTQITCRQQMALPTAGVELIRWALEGTFGGIKVITPDFAAEKEKERGKEENVNGNGAMEAADEEIGRTTVFEVMDCVRVECGGPQGKVVVEWEGNMVNDGIADAVVGVLLTVESSPAAVKQSAQTHTHAHTHAPPTKPSTPPSASTRLSRLLLLLESQFGSSAITPIARPRLPAPATTNGGAAPGMPDPDDPLSITPEEKHELQRLHALGIPVPGIEIAVGGHTAKVWLETLEVECANQVARERVRVAVERGIEVGAGLGG